MFIRVTTMKFQDGKLREYVDLTRQLVALMNLPVPCRFFTSDTGERNVFIMVAEAENPGDFMDRLRWALPENRQAIQDISAKLRELMVPGSWHEQIWEER